jgi:drug/metabolite transporter (DMT)-like permease
MAFTFGLLAALLWGLSDFLISITGRSFGVLRAMFYAQCVGVVLVGAWILVAGLGVPQAPASSWTAAIVAAPIGVAATLGLYQGLKVGQVSIVAPIAASFGAVTAVLSMFSGERLQAPILIGIILVISGVLLVSIQTRNSDAGAKTTGALWGAFCAITYGLQFWIQGRFAVPSLGSVWPVWIYYLISAAMLAVVVLARRQSMTLSRSGVATIAMTGSVAVSGFLALSAGLATGQLALVSVLASLQTVVTVCLAGIYHRERLTPRQWAGLAVTLGGLAAIHLS